MNEFIYQQIFYAAAAGYGCKAVDGSCHYHFTVSLGTWVENPSIFLSCQLLN